MDHLLVHYELGEENIMQLAISEAKARLTDLVRRAEAGEEVVLTRHGHAVARLVALHAKASGVHRANLIADIRARAAAKVSNGPKAARSQDFLYDEDGLPN
jgi:prevent-host-death family protein